MGYVLYGHALINIQSEQSKSVQNRHKIDNINMYTIAVLEPLNDDIPPEEIPYFCKC